MTPKENTFTNRLYTFRDDDRLETATTSKSIIINRLHTIGNREVSKTAIPKSRFADGGHTIGNREGSYVPTIFKSPVTDGRYTI